MTVTLTYIHLWLKHYFRIGWWLTVTNQYESNVLISGECSEPSKSTTPSASWYEREQEYVPVPYGTSRNSLAGRVIYHTTLNGPNSLQVMYRRYVSCIGNL